MSATRVEEVYKIIVHKCYDDYVGLWVIVSHLKTHGVKDEDAIRSETMKVVVRLMSSMGIVAGLPHADGSFERWPITRG